MRQSDPRSRERLDARDTRKTWVERYLGDGWTELEPGIYRHDAPAAPEEAGETPGRFTEAQYGENTEHGSPHPRRDDSERSESRR